MIWRAAVLFVLPLALSGAGGCGASPADAGGANPFKVGTREWVVEEVRRCRRETADAVTSIPDRDCYTFERPRQFAGIWVLGLEDSRFIAGGQSVRDVPEQGKSSSIWLETDAKSRMPRGWHNKSGIEGIYLVRFTGIEVEEKRPEGFGYGHMGMSNGLIIVDGMQQMTKLASD